MGWKIESLCLIKNKLQIKIPHDDTMTCKMNEVEIILLFFFFKYFEILSLLFIPKRRCVTTKFGSLYHMTNLHINSLFKSHNPATRLFC